MQEDEQDALICEILETQPVIACKGINHFGFKLYFEKLMRTLTQNLLCTV
jgi:hypothetical protein